MSQQIFNYTFTVRASLDAVAKFHHDTRALKWLTPLPMIAQMHRIDPMAEGSISEFTLWFFFIPIRWRAIHSNVDSKTGFTDTQARGPMKYWKHTHSFTIENENLTRVNEHIDYEYHSGWRGLGARLLFSPLGLWGLFFYRSLITRWSLERSSAVLVAR